MSKSTRAAIIPQPVRMEIRGIAYCTPNNEGN